MNQTQALNSVKGMLSHSREIVCSANKDKIEILFADFDEALINKVDVTKENIFLCFNEGPEDSYAFKFSSSSPNIVELKEKLRYAIQADITISSNAMQFSESTSLEKHVLQLQETFSEINSFWDKNL